MLNDDALLSMDDALLGWAFPKGQISLWLDTNEYIGVTSTIGILYTEVLHVKSTVSLHIGPLSTFVRPLPVLLQLVGVTSNVCIILSMGQWFRSLVGISLFLSCIGSW
jgi:hypothetical protein